MHNFKSGTTYQYDSLLLRAQNIILFGIRTVADDIQYAKNKNVTPSLSLSLSLSKKRNCSLFSILPNIFKKHNLCYCLSNMLARRFVRCSDQVKVLLYKSYCLSFYTCSLWANFTQRAYSALRV